METQNIIVALSFNTPRAKLIKVYQRLAGYHNWQYTHVLLVRVADNGFATIIDNHNTKGVPCTKQFREVEAARNYIISVYPEANDISMDYLENPASVRRLYTRHCVPLLLIPFALWLNIGKTCTFNVSRLLGFKRQLPPAAIVDYMQQGIRSRRGHPV